MAKNESIDELVSEKAFKQIEKLLSTVGIAKNEFGELIMEVVKLNNVMGSSKTFKEFQSHAENVNKKLKEVPTSIEKIRLGEIKLAKAREEAFDKYEKKLKKEVDAINRREAQAEKAHQKELARIEKEKLSNDKAAALNSKRITEQSRIYNQLSKTLEQNRKDAKDIGVVYGENSVQFQKAAKSVVELDARLKAIDAKLGQNQRNVGNYKSGFNGLGSSINQLTREFPAFANSVQTGFMALSNNFPIFFDEIKRTQAEIKALRAQGENVPGLFKQLTSSIFSWGTALSIGVTLLTVYGKEIGEFVGSLFKGKKALDEFALKQKTLNEVLNSGDLSSAIQTVSELRVNIGLAKDGFLDKEKVLKQYNETIGQTIGQADSLNEAEALMISKGNAYIQMTLQKAIAQAAAAEAAKKAVQAAVELERSDEESGSYIFSGLKGKAGYDKIYKREAEKNRKSASDAYSKEQDVFTKIFIDAQKKAADIAIKNGFNFFGGDKEGSNNALKELLEGNKIKLEAVKKNAELIYTDETKSLQDRLDALTLFTQKSQELIKLDQKLQLSEEGISAQKRKNIAADTQNRILDIQREGKEKEKQIKKEAEKELARILKDDLDQGILLIQEKGQDRLRLIEQQRSEALNALGEQYAQGLIKEKEYREQSYDIESAAAADRLQVQIDALKEEIKLEEESLKRGIGSNKALGIDVKKLADLEIEASNLKTKVAIENAEKEFQVKKELKEKEKELEYALFEFGEELVSAKFQREEERNTKALEDIDKRETKEKKALETQVLTQDEKAVKIAQIEAKAQVDREAIEKRQRILDINKARFQKASDILRIIGATGSAVAQALPNIPLSLLVGAIGAAQIAKVLATPIPKFEDGGEMKYTGLAEYGHGTELRIDPDGKYSLTKSTPEIGIVEKGTEFISNANLKRIFAKPDQTHYVGGQQIDINKLIEAQNNSSKRIEKALNSKAEHKTVITKGGIKYMYRNGNNETSYVNKNLN